MQVRLSLIVLFKNSKLNSEIMFEEITVSAIIDNGRTDCKASFLE